MGDPSLEHVLLRSVERRDPVLPRESLDIDGQVCQGGGGNSNVLESAGPEDLVPVCDKGRLPSDGLKPQGGSAQQGQRLQGSVP